jgi:HEAT repeat protein
MPLRFHCTNCRHLLSIGRRKAGSETTCPICRHPQKVPDLATPAQETPAATSKPRRAAEMTARLVSLALALALLGILGGFIWIFPNPLLPSKEPRHEDEVQRVSLDQNRFLPLVQEVESAPRNAPASPLPPPPAPPNAAKRPSNSLPATDRRPPDLHSPAPAAKNIPKKKPSPPRTNRGEAELLGDELVEAAPERQEALLQKLREGKGSEYTQALAAAIGRLSDEAKKKAREILIERLTRFTSNTLLSYLGIDDAELRRAAVLAFGNKDNKDHISELIDLLEDPDPSVVDAVHVALTRLTSPDTGAKTAPEKRAEAVPNRSPDAQTRTSISRPVPPPEEGNPPATDSLASKAKPQKKDDDVPEVSLVPPPETSPEMKAFLRANALALYSKKPSERIQAARVLGGLSDQGKPARRHLCAAMLDPVLEVRVAAADALKNIDPKMHYLAVVLATEKVASNYDARRVETLLAKIQKLQEDGEPLAPLVIHVVKFAVSSGTHSLLTTSLTTLSRIGRKDLSSYRVVATALNNRDPSIRVIALRGLARMKHGKLAVPKILALLRMETPLNRIAAMEALAALADESTEEIVAEAIAAQRYHNEESVRRAVDAALNKLENKQNP